MMGNPLTAKDTKDNTKEHKGGKVFKSPGLLVFWSPSLSTEAFFDLRSFSEAGSVGGFSSSPTTLFLVC